MAMPQKVPFDYTVFLGGAAGGIVAVLNFFFMGLAVQKAAAATDEDSARMRIKASYSQRMMIQMLWGIIAIVAPCFHFVAGIVPILFPGTGIKIAGIFHNKKKGKGVLTKRTSIQNLTGRKTGNCETIADVLGCLWSVPGETGGEYRVWSWILPGQGYSLDCRSMCLFLGS